MITTKQKEFIHESNKVWNLKIGAVRSGKTYIDFFYEIPKQARAMKDLDGLFVLMGVSQSTIERNILEPMRSLYGERMVGNIQTSRSLVKLFGQDFHVVGHEKANAVKRIQGSSIKYCYVDECVAMNEEVFDMLKSRLDKDYSRCTMTGNPEEPSHFIKKFIDEEIEHIYYQHYILEDNPFLSPEYVERLKREYKGTVLEKRYIKGQWALAEGSIYPMLNEKHKVSLKEWEELKEDVRFVQVGVDFGGNQSKTAFQATAVMNDKSIITIKEQRFELEEDIDKINQEFEKFIQDLTDQKYEIRIVRLDSAEQVIINSMRKYARKGFISPKKLRNARKGAINERIRTYQRLLNLYKYRILETCTITYEAFENAVWSDKVDSKGKDVRLDNGTLNIDTLDAQEYSTEELHDSLLKG